MQPHVFNKDPAQFTCPLTYFRDNPDMEARAFALHLNWKQGILPSPGALDDQPAHYQLVVTAVEMGVNAGQNRLQEVTLKKSERGNKGTKPNRARSRRSR